jgi:hypothetical protein
LTAWDLVVAAGTVSQMRNDQRAAGRLAGEFGRAFELIGLMLTSFGAR